MVTLAPRTAGEAPSDLLPDALRAAIESLLAGALAGRGAARLATGRPAPSLHGLADGFTVLRAAAAESEADLPYAVLADVLRPVLHRASALPEPQAHALREAFDLAQPAGSGRLAVCAGTLGLLASAAPVVVVLDEAQWADEQSAEALLYAFRRLDGLRIAAVVGGAAGDSRFCGLEPLESRVAALPERAPRSLTASSWPPRTQERAARPTGRSGCSTRRSGARTTRSSAPTRSTSAGSSRCGGPRRRRRRGNCSRRPHGYRSSTRSGPRG